MTRAPFLVGLVAIAATGTLSFFVVTTSKDRFDEERTYTLFADFDDASGIRWKTRLQMNGIDVGKVESIEHVRNDQGRLVARARLKVLKGYDVHANSKLRKVAESLLGDYRLELDPGTPATAAVTDGGHVGEVVSASELEELQGQLRRVVGNVEQVTQSFASVLAGPQGEGSIKEILSLVSRSMAAIEATTRVLADTVSRNDQLIDSVMKNLGDFSSNVARASGPQGELTALSKELAGLSEKLAHTVEVASDMLRRDDVSRDSDEENATLQSTMNHLNESLQHVATIARKIDEGQGSVGRMINDSRIAEQVEQTLEDSRELIGSLSRIETQIELRSEYDVPFEASNNEVQSAIKNTVGVRLVPRPDKYYILEAIADPRGRQTREIKTITDDNGTTKLEESVISFNALKFSAQFAKRYYFLTMRFGIIENTGGLGVNLHAIEDALELRLDAFDFDRRDPSRGKAINPRFRATGMFEIMSHVSLQAGLDDPFNRKLRTWFLGGVLRFTDEDLKALLTVAPSPI